MNSLTFVSTSITRALHESTTEYGFRIESLLSGISNDVDVVVFPEYCWGDASIEEVEVQLNQIRSKFKFNIIFGSLPFDLKTGITTNNAIISILGKDIIYSPKTIPMEGERDHHNIKPGPNIGVIEINGIKSGIVICADLWNWKLIYELVVKKGVKVLLVPAFTIVPKGHRDYAKYQWLSLAITRSREFVVPIIIADHSKNGDDYDVGAVTCIIDPSVKNPSIRSIHDFIYSTENNFVSRKINFELIKEYRDYRERNGLLQK
ncbi:MAG: nitrilase-related carbon-nitrogen hydrolase [Candidatus Kariarchaeaceae archaeon]|jgi:predicted amidohydrolase